MLGTRHTRIIAHRGASAEEPEHTLAAYRLALAQGAEGIECDVRLTRDGHLVCFHDRRIERTSSGTGTISWQHLHELTEHDYGSWKERLGAHPDEERDPARHELLTFQRLLAEVMAAAAGGHDLVFLVETKHPNRHGQRIEMALARQLRRAGLAFGDREGMPWVRVMSFSHLALASFGSLAPQVPRVHLLDPSVPTLRWRERLPWGVRIAGPGIDQVRADPGMVARHHRAGHDVAVWTANEDADIELCLDLGVDLLITDRPAAALAIRDGR